MRSGVGALRSSWSFPPFKEAPQRRDETGKIILNWAVRQALSHAITKRPIPLRRFVNVVTAFHHVPNSKLEGAELLRFHGALSWVVDHFERPNGPLELCTVKDLSGVLQMFARVYKHLPSDLRLRGVAALVKHVDKKVIDAMDFVALADTAYLVTQIYIPALTPTVLDNLKRSVSLEVPPESLARVVHALAVLDDDVPAVVKMLEKFSSNLKVVLKIEPIVDVCDGLNRIYGIEHIVEVKSCVWHIATHIAVSSSLKAQLRSQRHRCQIVLETFARMHVEKTGLEDFLYSVAREAFSPGNTAWTMSMVASVAWSMSKLRLPAPLFVTLATSLAQRCKGEDAPQPIPPHAFANLVFTLARRSTASQGLFEALQAKYPPLPGSRGPSRLMIQAKHIWAFSKVGILPAPPALDLLLVTLDGPEVEWKVVHLLVSVLIETNLLDTVATPLLDFAVRCGYGRQVPIHGVSRVIRGLQKKHLVHQPLWKQFRSRLKE